MQQNLTLEIPNMLTPKTSTIFTKAIIRLEWPKMLIPLSTWFNSNDFNECNSRKLPITNLLSLIDSFSQTLKWTHSSHMDQKFISYSFSCVMSRCLASQVIWQSQVPFFYIVAHQFLRLVILAISLNLKTTLLLCVHTTAVQDKILALLDKVPWLQHYWAHQLPRRAQIVLNQLEQHGLSHGEIWTSQ